MSQQEILIIESATINALATTTVTSGEITTLAHELLNNSVESRALVVQGLSLLAHTLLASAQGTKILSSAGYNVRALLK